MKKILVILAFALAITSCGGDDDNINCTSQEFNDLVQSELAKVDAAGTAWATDPTQANCDAFKSAANSYINAVQNFDGCDGISQSSYDQAVLAAQAAVDAIPC